MVHLREEQSQQQTTATSELKSATEWNSNRARLASATLVLYPCHKQGKRPVNHQLRVLVTDEANQCVVLHITAEFSIAEDGDLTIAQRTGVGLPGRRQSPEGQLRAESV